MVIIVLVIILADCKAMNTKNFIEVWIVFFINFDPLSVLLLVKNIALKLISNGHSVKSTIYL